MNVQTAHLNAFSHRMAQLSSDHRAATKQASVMSKLVGYEKQAGLGNLAGKVVSKGKDLASAAKGKVRLDPSYASSSKIKLPGLNQAILEQTGAARKVQTEALKNRAAAAAKPAPTPLKMAPEAPAAAPAGAAAAPAGAAAGGAAADAATSASQVAAGAPMSIADRVGRYVGGMNPGMGRRALAGPGFDGASPLNPADLGRSVMERAGIAGGGAALAGGTYVKGQADAAAEAKRRASQMGFMQRLAFLMNPNIVNTM